MDRKLQELLTRIFYEGHVVDFDFSKWDHFVRLVVVASAFPLQADQRFPLFNVDFSGVMEIRWKGNHIGIELAEPWHHCQWCTMEYECRQTGDGYEIQINDVGVVVSVWVAQRIVRLIIMQADEVLARLERWRLDRRPGNHNFERHCCVNSTDPEYTFPSWAVNRTSARGLFVEMIGSTLARKTPP